MIADSIVFEQLIYCSFLQTEVGGEKYWSFLCGCHKWRTSNLSDLMNLAVTQDPRDRDLVVKGYKTRSFSVSKTVESHVSLFISPNKQARSFNMLYNANVILNKLLYRKCLLFGVCKYLIYSFYIAAQFVTSGDNTKFLFGRRQCKDVRSRL